MINMPGFPSFSLRKARRASGAPNQCLRVGTDLTWIPQVKESLAQFGDRYLNRVFTVREQDDCRGDIEKRSASLAARFAAKEAVMKLLQLPNDIAIPWRAIEVRRLANGNPDVKLSGLAFSFARESKIRRITISLTHENEYASAVAIAICG